MTVARTATISTQIGPFTVVVSDTPEGPVVLASGWTDGPQDLLPVIAPSLRPLTTTDVRRIDSITDAAVAYHEGDLTAIDDVAVQQKSGPFLTHAWEVLRLVKPGQPVTYKEFAERSGRPTAIRPAASACARNAVGLFVPCHRVLGSNGSSGGFRWGVRAKTWLLEHERQD